MRRLGERSRTIAGIALCVLALVSAACGPDEEDPEPDRTPATERPGACVCYDGMLNRRCCVVTPSYDACLDSVTICNPFFYTNTDCSQWPYTPTCPTQ